MKRTKQRTIFSYWLLLIIAFSNKYLAIAWLDISLTFIIIFIGGFLLFTQLPNKFFNLFVSFTVMIAYTSFLIWEKQAPVWIIMPRVIFIPFLFVILITFLVKGFYQRLVVALIGLCDGELLYSVMMANYLISEIVGESTFLDSFFSLIILLILLELISQLRLKITCYIRHNIKSIRLAK